MWRPGESLWRKNPVCPRRDRTPTHTLSHSSHSLLPLTVCVWVWLTASSPALHFTSVAHTHTHAQQIGLKRISLLSLCYFRSSVCVLRSEQKKKKASVFNEFVPKALIHTYAVHTHTSAVYIYTNSVFIWIWTAVGMDSSSSPMSLIAGVKCNLSAPVRVENAGWRLRRLSTHTAVRAEHTASG